MISFEQSGTWACTTSGRPALRSAAIRSYSPSSQASAAGSARAPAGIDPMARTRARARSRDRMISDNARDRRFVLSPGGAMLSPPMGSPADADLELAFYEKFLFSRGIEPYPVQEQAFTRIFAGDNVLVTVPTGTGKTLMAKAGLFKALARGQTAVYTTP